MVSLHSPEFVHLLDTAIAHTHRCNPTLTVLQVSKIHRGCPITAASNEERISLAKRKERKTIDAHIAKAMQRHSIDKRQDFSFTHL